MNLCPLCKQPYTQCNCQPDEAINSKNSQALIEGEDYYFEGDLMVFTRLYHLRKGYCCNNDCRHCPYEK